ncbi:hypothetical protein KTAU_25970 [Thermogemmatispora aurantia]|jgi:hypothetical protein|uniref:Uncharacterized protein n=1 Tax=Thermogemmatispora aurantia TaxID=2045279 RepID=A0A5J4KBA9_9CHLR|nr:hypothetical protein KTAU_25970 [Thermogemmatispora aurantia]
MAPASGLDAIAGQGISAHTLAECQLAACQTLGAYPLPCALQNSRQQNPYDNANNIARIRLMLVSPLP